MTHESVRAAFSVSLGPDSATAPADIQYMPPGRHTIRAHRAGKPVTVSVFVDANTAATLQQFLAAHLAAAAEGRDDRPFLDFNHEDREAAAWPTEFFWAGDDPLTGGVRARVEWSDAGRRAVEGRTFRRFSPTFVPDAEGRVIGSEINMGGLVNRAAFKRIAALFASTSASPEPVERVDTTPAANRMQTLVAKLLSLGLVEAAASEEADLVAQLTRSVTGLKSRITELESTIATQAKARAESHIDAAIKAGRLPPADEPMRAFWLDALTRDESRAVKALQALPVNPVLARVTTDADTSPASIATSQLAQQEAKLAAVRAANPGADFATIYAKAKAEAPDLFR